MAKFQFSMQSLLQIKEKLEEQCQMEYGKAVQQRDLQIRKVNKIRDLIETENRTFYEKQASVFVVRDLIRVQDKISYLKNKEKEAVSQLSYLEEMVLESRQKLAKAMQERKIYETLREKALERYYEEEKQEELKLMDERASFNHSRE
ncbi:hypothetical protein EII17_05380 [Clostridiales bacterium COT073_COT-073]|nr:hypothetical protein EII17_05380 [Clostridiales bacterium COT073_COT-073]